MKQETRIQRLGKIRYMNSFRPNKNVPDSSDVIFMAARHNEEVRTLVAKVICGVGMLLVPFYSFADSWTDPSTGYTWTYDLYYDGAQMQTISPTPTGVVIIPSRLGGEPVTSIYPRAFEDCSGLTSVTIPNGVTSIGWNAFYGCSGLTNVTIPNSMTSIGYSAFLGCSNLTSVTIPSGDIGDDAFAGCNGLTNLTIGTDVTSIGSGAFSRCSGLTSVTLPNRVKSIESFMFSGCSGLTSVTIPNGVTTIEAYAFRGCSGLTSVSIPNSVNTIETEVFSGCSGLKVVTIPQYVCSSRISTVFPDAYHSITNITVLNGVTSIGDWAFSYCSGLTSISIPDSLTSVGQSAFNGCTGLTAVNITDLAVWCGVDFANAGANPLTYAHTLYLNGESVTDMTIPDGVKGIGDYVFCNCKGLKNVTIPDNVTSIGWSAFEGCSGLTNVTIPNSMTSIESSVFRGCSCLTSVTIPNGVTNIETYAFSGCSGLTSVTIPNGVTSIKNEAFHGCSGLMNMSIPDSVRTIGTDAFSGCSGLMIVTIPQYVCSSRMSTVFPDAYQSMTNITILNGVMDIGRDSFSGCREVTSITIPISVTNIGKNAFSGCRELASIAIPEGVTSIGWSAFEGCTGLTAVNITDLTAWCGIVFENAYSNPLTYAHNLYLNGVLVSDLVISDDVTNVGAYAFYGGAGLDSVTIPDSVTYIGTYAFYSCTGVDSVMIPKSVRSIGRDAFAGCSFGVTVSAESLAGLQENVFGECGVTVVVNEDGQYVPDCVASNVWKVVFADGVKQIPDNYFRIGVDGHARRMTLPNLQTMDIAESVVRIGTNVFEACSALETVVTNGVVLYQGWAVCRQDGGAPYGGGGALVIPDGVRGIVAGAFEGEYGIEEMVLPSTLRFVGAGAFRDCTGLEYIALPEGVVAVNPEAFRNCTYAQELSLPSTLREIGAGAFANCSQLMGVTLPDGVLDVGEVAFSNCWRMLSASIPCNVTNVGAGAFMECRRLTGVTVPLGLATVAELFPAAYGSVESVVVAAETAAPHSGEATGETLVKPPMVPGMFAGCGAMESLTFPEDLAEVSVEAFVGCTNMAAFNLPDTVTNIGARAFKDLEQLTAFAFPTGLVVVGEESFAGCAGLVALPLPDGLRKVGARAFDGLSLLARVDIPGSVTDVGAAAFGGCTRVRAISLPCDAATVASMFPDTYELIASATVVDCAARSASAPYQMMPSLFEGCVALVAVEMPPSLTVIGARAFKGCSSLTAVGIPSGVAELGEEAFMGCANLSQIALPNGLGVLPSRAFANCVSLTEITVPESVGELGADVFTGCGLLRSVRFVGNAPAYDAAAYGGTDTALVTYVPNGSMGWDGVPTSRALPEFWPDGTAHEITWWEPNRYLVDFIADGGTGVVTAQVEQVTGTTYVLPPDATRQGAAFGGWWTAAEGGARVTAVTQVALTRPHAFYAHWTFNRYSVVFDANGGEGTMDALGLTVATGATLPECGFSRIGYVFAGWATEPDGEVVYTNAADVLDLAYKQGASVTLYAVWEVRDWTLADYVDCDNVVFSNDAAAWTPDSSTYKRGGVSLRSGVVDAAAEGERTNTTLTASVVGAGSGSFWWKVNCEEMDAEYDEWYDYAVFTIDGAEVAKIAGDSGWRQVEYTVTGAGPHVLAWTFSRDDYDEESVPWENAAWLDDVAWTPTPVTVTFASGGATEGEVPTAITKYAGYELTLPGPGTLVNGTYVFMGWSDGEMTFASGTTYVFGSTNTTLTAVWGERVWTLGEAVDAEMLSFTTGGDADWFVDGSTGWTNGVSAKSGTVTSGQVSWIETTVNGAGTLSFRWNVMGGIYRNTPFAFAKVEVDGEQQAQECRTDGWKEQTATVEGAGAHTIRWAYQRTSTRTADGDCAWLDAVAWTPTPDPIPEISGDADVAGALVGAADSRLASHIKTAAEYNAFRGWVNAKGLDHQTVKDSPRAWFSYAIGANGLVEKVFQNGDVTIDSLETESGGSFTFEVNVKDVLIGAGATAANLATVFEVQGSSSLSSNSFSRAKVNVTFGVSANGKLLVSATPKLEYGTFFVRVRMYADEEMPEEDKIEVEDTYTVTYCPGANGIGSQQTATKTYGVALALRGATFTRSGYTQTGWSTSDGGSKAYDLGAFYTANAAVTLFPFWTADTYTVTYTPGANGSGSQQTATKTHGVALTLKGATFMRSGYTQTGWSTSDGGVKAYDLGESYVDNAAMTLYPYWTENTGGNGGSLQGLYCVIDLSAGTNAVSYPVTYMASEPSGGFNTDEYKTTKIVLRRIEPGSFKMGGQYDVTLTKAYYIGVFEVTQRQYELVMGSNPSQYKGDMRPVEMVPYDVIRGSTNGAMWPESSGVDSNSFMGKLRMRTELDFDLPTEAQWEYACRAGTTSPYNNGGSSANDLEQLGRYVDNQFDGKGGYSEHTKVGSYLPNAWGLYDMHGNALERCLDWFGTLTNGEDPHGPSSGSERVRRGGAFSWFASWCTAFYRDSGLFGTGIAPSSAGNGDGFRLALTLGDDET